MTFGDYLVAAIAFGANDSCNPYMLSMVLCSLTFLALTGSAPQHIVRSGRFAIGTVFLLTFGRVWIENTLWLEYPAVNRILYFFSLGVAVFLLVVGFLLFQQWRQGKTSASAQQLPRFLLENQEVTGKNVVIFFPAVILGLATVLLGSLWPKDPNIYAFYYFLFARSNVLLTALFFALYGLAFALPLLTVWGIIFYVKRSAKLRNDLLGAISWLRICFSSLFIAVGLGLVYLFIVT